MQKRFTVTSYYDNDWSMLHGAFTLDLVRRQGHEVIRTNAKSGVYSDGYEKLVDYIKEQFTLICQYEDYSSYFESSDNNTCIRLTKVDNVTKEVAVAYSSVNEQHISFLNELLKKIVEETKNVTGRVYAITAARNGPKISSIGHGGIALERGNYSKANVDDFDYVVKEFGSPDPFGRLVIISGPPGTGKSYYIRGLIEESKDCTFVVLPHKLVTELDSPSLLTMLIDRRFDYDEGVIPTLPSEGSSQQKKESIVLIIEEADMFLAKRDADNVSLLSSLLNYTDGIFGSLMNLKVIATTNRDVLEIDEALKRPGRLSKQILINKIEKEQANMIYSRLTKQELTDVFDKPVNLVDVYAKAKHAQNNGAAEKKEKKVGFT